MTYSPEKTNELCNQTHARMKRHRSDMQAYGQLSRMNDRMLRNKGLTRDQVNTRFTKGFLGQPRKRPARRPLRQTCAIGSGIHDLTA